jgi:hypothetical protein
MLTSSSIGYDPSPKNHGDAVVVTFAGCIVPCFLLLHERPSPAHSSQFLMQFPPSLQHLGMKFAFKTKTEPTLHVGVVIAVIVTSSGALAMIMVSLANSSVATYCVIVLALIIWVVVTKTSP